MQARRGQGVVAAALPVTAGGGEGGDWLALLASPEPTAGVSAPTPTAPDAPGSAVESLCVTCGRSGLLGSVVCDPLDDPSPVALEPSPPPALGGGLSFGAGEPLALESPEPAEPVLELEPLPALGAAAPDELELLPEPVLGVGEEPEPLCGAGACGSGIASPPACGLIVAKGRSTPAPRRLGVAGARPATPRVSTARELDAAPLAGSGRKWTAPRVAAR
jgi:hypothetical protein